jgi:hypothetical protein
VEYANSAQGTTSSARDTVSHALSTQFLALRQVHVNVALDSSLTNLEFVPGSVELMRSTTHSPKNATASEGWEELVVSVLPVLLVLPPPPMEKDAQLVVQTRS